MITFLYILLILIGVVFEWPKNSKVYDAIVIALCTYMVGTCTTHADYNAYLMKYLFADQDAGLLNEPLWSSLMILYRNLGVSYNVFIAIQTCVCLLLIAYAARKMQISTPFLWAMFLTYPGLLAFVQFRQLFATSIVFLAFAELVIRQGRTRYVIYLILVFIAGMIHNTALFMLLLPLIARFNNHRFFLVLFIAAILVSAFNSGWMLDIAKKIFTDEVSQAYLAGYGGVASDISKIFTICEVVGSIAILLIGDRSASFSVNENERAAFSYLFPLSLFFVAVIPVLMVNTDFLRLCRYPLLLNMSVLSVFSPLSSDGFQRHYSRHRLFFLRLLCLLYYGALFYGLVWMQAPDTVVGAMLQWRS